MNKTEKVAGFQQDYRNFSKVRIRFDLDDTLLEVFGKFAGWHNLWFSTAVTARDLHLADYAKMSDLLQCPTAAWLKRFQDFHQTEHHQLEPLEFSYRVVWRLQSRGHDLGIVTHRSPCLEELTRETVFRHYQNLIPKVSLHGLLEDQETKDLIPKWSILLQDEVRIYFEDNFSNACSCALQADAWVFLFDPHNLYCDCDVPDKVIIIHGGWREVDSIIPSKW